IPLPSLKKQQDIVFNLEYFLSEIGKGRKEQANSIEEIQKLWRHTAIKILHEFPPTCWRFLHEVIDIQGGCTPSKSNPAFFNGNVPWIRPQNMKTIEIYQSSDYISQFAIDNSPLKIFQPGTVLVVIRGMILVHTVPSA